MISLKNLKELTTHSISLIFCDIDDTISHNGKIHANAYNALWKLFESGFTLVPVTGRPAGWCELIARFWPVHGVIGENGGFYFRHASGTMKRFYFQSVEERESNQKKLAEVRDKILMDVPGAAVASDQFCRQLDLAIDFCEDVDPLPASDIDKIVDHFHSAGAIAKVSSIHVNGWFGDHDKFKMVKTYCENELSLTWENANSKAVFIGDSPNDEPMFENFKLSVAVENISEFKERLTHLPKYICNEKGGDGFTEFANTLIASKKEN